MPFWAMVFLFFMWFMVDSASKAHFPSTNVLPSRLEKPRKKIKYGSIRTEGFQRAIGKPFGRARRREIPCNNQKIVDFFRQLCLSFLSNRSLA